MASAVVSSSTSSSNASRLRQHGRRLARGSGGCVVYVVWVWGSKYSQIGSFARCWRHEHSRVMMIMHLACSFGARCPPHGNDEQALLQRTSCVMPNSLPLPKATHPHIPATNLHSHRHDEFILTFIYAFMPVAALTGVGGVRRAGRQPSPLLCTASFHHHASAPSTTHTATGRLKPTTCRSNSSLEASRTRPHGYVERTSCRTL